MTEYISPSVPLSVVKPTASACFMDVELLRRLTLTLMLEPSAPKPGSPPTQSARQLNLSDQAIRDLLSLDFLEYFEAQDPELPAYTRLYLAAAAFHGILGVNLSAREEAVRVMGGALAALVVAVIDRNRFHPTHPVHSPGFSGN